LSYHDSSKEKSAQSALGAGAGSDCAEPAQARGVQQRCQDQEEDAAAQEEYGNEEEDREQGSTTCGQRLRLVGEHKADRQRSSNDQGCAQMLEFEIGHFTSCQEELHAVICTEREDRGCHETPGSVSEG